MYGLIWLSLFTLSCNHNTEKEFKLGSQLSVRLPVSWQLKKLKSMDTWTAVIVTSNQDTIWIDIGDYVDDLTETIVILPLHVKDSIDLSPYEGATIFFDQHPHEAFERRKYHQTTDKYFTIDTHKIKEVEGIRDSKRFIGYHIASQNVTIWSYDLSVEDLVVLKSAMKTGQILNHR